MDPVLTPKERNAAKRAAQEAVKASKAKAGQPSQNVGATNSLPATKEPPVLTFAEKLKQQKAPPQSKASGQAIAGTLAMNYNTRQNERRPYLPIRETTFNRNYRSHGDFVSADGKQKIHDVEKYIRDNVDDFEYQPNDSTEICKRFKAELGPNKKNAWGENGPWFITINYFPNTKTANITHYGPFGIGTNDMLTK